MGYLWVMHIVWVLYTVSDLIPVEIWFVFLYVLSIKIRISYGTFPCGASKTLPINAENSLYPFFRGLRLVYI